MQTPAKPVLKRLCGLFIWFSTLCTTDEKRLEIAVFRCVSGNSDPEGRWFASSRAHHQAEPGRNSRSGLSFLFYLFARVFSGYLFCQRFPVENLDAQVAFEAFSLLHYGFALASIAGIFCVNASHTCGEQFAHRRFFILAVVPAFKAGICFVNTFLLVANDLSLAVSFSFHCKVHRAFILLLPPFPNRNRCAAAFPAARKYRV